jgi:GNAT superfamily N-acetyltransferase
MLIETTVSCPIKNSFRVQQIAGLFDVPLAERAQESFRVELPSLAEPWTIGVIVGPSGSGKSTVARAAYGDAVYQQYAWPRDRAIIDCFGNAPTREIAAMLTAVGFSSPPSWVKPYHVLSGGERFRCDLARALLEGRGDRGEGQGKYDRRLVVFDEFTSVVDRTVAKVGSAAVAKTIRRLSSPSPLPPGPSPLPLRFIAVTCHYDVVPWLEPDWVLDMATRELRRGWLRRPDIVLEVVQCPQKTWGLFSRHHYLSGELARAATCYAALWNGEPVAFCATCGMYGRVGRKRVTRIVVLPDYQGLGIGMRLVEHVCRHEASKGFRCNITASHPAVIEHCKRSPLWQTIGIKRAPGKSQQTAHGLDVKTATGRCVVSFEFMPCGLARIH